MVPAEFNWEEYLSINTDLLSIGIKTEEQAKQHYLYYGRQEERKYKITDKPLPSDFNWEEYISLNRDLPRYGIITEEQAKQHYLIFGKHEERKYKITIKPLPNNFNWEEYLSLNSDLPGSGIITEAQAKDHYLNHGRQEKRKYKNYIGEVYIICKNNAGGSWKYLDDIMNKYDNYEYIFLSDLNQIKSLKKNSIVILQYFFWFSINIHSFSIDIQQNNLKLLIPIHDFYWFSEDIINEYNPDVIHGGYLNVNKIDNSVKELFNIAYKVICPSDFVYKEYSKYFNTSNFITVPHNDYLVTNELIIPKIHKKVINIGIFCEYSIYKGKESYEYLENTVVQYKGYFLKYLIVGKNIPKYNESDFYEYVSRYNIHAFLLLNKWGETYCYTLTKILNSGLPIFYNNIGAFKERIPTSEHYFINSNSESEYSDTVLLKERFCKFLDYLIANNRNDSYKQILSNKIDYAPFYNKIFKKNNITIEEIIKKINKKNLCFIHFTNVGNGHSIFLEQIDTIKKSGLYNQLDFIFVILLGPYIEIKEDDKIKVIYYSDNILEWEFPSLNIIRSFSNDIPYKVNILYIHTKGVLGKPGALEWRKYLEYFLIEKYDICLRYLNNGNFSVGVDLHTYPLESGNGYRNHYSGNFWWSQSEYIKSITKTNLYIEDRYSPEHFIIGNYHMLDNSKIIELHNSKKDFYTEVINPSEYRSHKQ